MNKSKILEILHDRRQITYFTKTAAIAASHISGGYDIYELIQSFIIV